MRQAELQRTLMQAASRAEGFAYHGYRMTEAWTAGPPDTPLGRFHSKLGSKETLEAIRTVTGSSAFDNVFAQATDYRPGHYLTRHLDDPKGESDVHLGGTFIEVAQPRQARRLTTIDPASIGPFPERPIKGFWPQLRFAPVENVAL